MYLCRSVNKFEESILVEYRKIVESNKALFRLAERQKLHQLMHVRKFLPRLHWMPPGLKLTKNLETVLCSWEEDFQNEFAYENKVSKSFGSIPFVN